MTKSPRLPPQKTTPCPGCGGSGQTGSFRGESRFQITWEDCPDCAGTGVDLNRPGPLPHSSGEQIPDDQPKKKRTP
jgi:DnaJ-class molecular chaperone